MVSIIIPYYNRSDKLRRTLDSVYNQTYKNFEVIIVDDCSEVPFEHDAYLLTYIRNSENKGPGVSRNIGMQKAKGEFIAFLDSDDYWHPNFLKEVLRGLKNSPNSIMCYAKGIYVDASEKFVKPMREDAKTAYTILPNILEHGRPWGTGACIWRAKIVRNIRWPETRGWEDYVFDVRAAILNNTIEAVETNLVFYDQSGDDRLSATNPKNSTLLRNKALEQISNNIKASHFFKNKKIRKSILYLTLSNTI